MLNWMKEKPRLQKCCQANCGGCGYPGCSGLAAALIGKETDTVSCKPCKADRKKEIVDYLNSTPGPDGECLKVKA